MIQYRFGIWYLKCDDIWIANFLNQEDNESETEELKVTKYKKCVIRKSFQLILKEKVGAELCQAQTSLVKLC